MSQFYVTLINIIKTCYIVNSNEKYRIEDLETFLELQFKLLNQFEIDHKYKTEIQRCLRLFYLTSNFLKFELAETHLQVHVTYLMNSYDKLLKTIFSNERNVALVMSKMIKQDYTFFDLLMEYLEQIKLLPKQLTAIQHLLTKYDVITFVEKTIDEIEFSTVNGQYIMIVRNKYFGSLSNCKKFLDFISVLLKNNSNFASKIFTASSKDPKKTSIFKFIILAHLQSTLRSVYHNTLVAINTLFYSSGNQFFGKTHQKAAIADIFYDIIEKYDFSNDLNFYKLIEVLIDNQEQFVIKRINDRLGLTLLIAESVHKMRSKRRKLLAIKIMQYFIQIGDFVLTDSQTARFYDETLMSLHRNANNTLLPYLKSILLAIPQQGLDKMSVNMDFENLVTCESNMADVKSIISS